MPPEEVKNIIANKPSPAPETYDPSRLLAELIDPTIDPASMTKDKAGAQRKKGLDFLKANFREFTIVKYSVQAKFAGMHRF